MKAVAENLRETVRTVEPHLRALREPEVSAARAPGKWSRKQILGHLVDSAGNNLQRIVRAQLVASELEFPSYEQDGWVRVQAHSAAEWSNLVDLWRSLNLHLAHLIERIPPDRLETPCRIGGKEALQLSFLVEDYVRHLDHHLAQL